MIKSVQRFAAFTIIELLVAVTIIGVLVELLLPSVQAAREAARRHNCQAHLKQVGLAVLTYEASRREFPAGARAQTSIGSQNATAGVSWWVDVLPFMEQNALAQRFDRTHANSGCALLNLRNGMLVNGVAIESMACPSGLFPQLWPVGEFQVMMPSYEGIAGATEDDEFAEARLSMCCESRLDGQLSGGGLLIPNASVAARDVTDGLSTTLLAGEASDFVLDAQGVSQRVDGGFAYGWPMGTKSPGTPPMYGTKEAFPAWNITTIRYHINERDYTLPGILNIRGANNPLVSTHPGGAMLLLADGSVRIGSDTIDLVALKRLATRDDGLASQASLDP